MRNGLVFIFFSLLVGPAVADGGTGSRRSSPHGALRALSFCELRKFEVFGAGKITSISEKTETLQGGGMSVEATSITIKLDAAADATRPGLVTAFLLGSVASDGSSEVGSERVDLASQYYFFLHRAGDNLILTRQGLFRRGDTGLYSNAGLFARGLSDSYMNAAVRTSRDACLEPEPPPVSDSVLP